MAELALIKGKSKLQSWNRARQRAHGTAQGRFKVLPGLIGCNSSRQAPPFSGLLSPFPHFPPPPFSSHRIPLRNREAAIFSED